MPASLPIASAPQLARIQPHYLAHWISKRPYALLTCIIAQRQCRSSDNQGTSRTQLRYHPAVLADATIFPASSLSSNVALSSCTSMMTMPKLAPVYDLPMR